MKSGFWKGLILGVALSIFALIGVSAFGQLVFHEVFPEEINSSQDPESLEAHAFNIAQDSESIFKAELPSDYARKKVDNDMIEMLYIQVKQNNMIIDRLDQLLNK